MNKVGDIGAQAGERSPVFLTIRWFLRHNPLRGRKAAIPEWAQAKLKQRLITHFPIATVWRYWCEDESRFGLKTIERRRITARGIQPVGMHQWVFETFWLYGAVEPKSGESFFWEFFHLDSLCFERYLEYFTQAYPNQMHLMQVDRADAHTAVELHVSDNMILLFQPPYAPQLNPIERF